MKVLPSFALNDISSDVSTARKIGITGNTQNRFIQAAVLLHLLDPVRGEPTAYGLDRDPNEYRTAAIGNFSFSFVSRLFVACFLEA
jgi:hypothetical protein